MRKHRIKQLKEYRKLLMDIKMFKLHQQLSEEVENKLPTYQKSKDKVMVKTLFK